MAENSANGNENRSQICRAEKVMPVKSRVNTLLATPFMLLLALTAKRPSEEKHFLLLKEK